MFATAYRHEARLLMTEGYVSTWVEEVADLVSRPARGEFERHYGLPAPVTEEIPLRKYVLMISLPPAPWSIQHLRLTGSMRKCVTAPAHVREHAGAHDLCALLMSSRCLTV